METHTCTHYSSNILTSGKNIGCRSEMFFYFLFFEVSRLKKLWVKKHTNKKIKET